MTRTVFEASMVAHIWANQSQDSARTANGNFYFNGPRIYSYGGHFLVGVVLPGVGPVLNSDRYSMTTNRHQSEAGRAVRWNAPHLPKLTDAEPWLSRLAAAYVSTGETARHYRANAAGARKSAAEYLERHAATLGDDAGALVLRLSGSRGDWAKFKARALAKAERKRAAEIKAAKAGARKLAAEIAAVPLPVIKARAVAMGDSINRTLIDYRAAHLNAGGPRIKAAVWARLKAVRAIAKRRESSNGSRAYRGRHYENAQARVAIANLRRIELRDWNAAGIETGGRYPFGRSRACRLLEESSREALRAHMPPATRERLARQVRVAKAAGDRLYDRQKAREAKATARAELRRTVRALIDWRNAARDGLRDNYSGEARDFAQWIETAPPVSVVRTLNAIESNLRNFAAAGRFPALLAPLNAILVERVLPAQTAANARLEADREAERANRERLARMSPAERRAAWQAGEPGVTLNEYRDSEGGPALRAVGAVIDGCTVTAGELETSQGARVPLRHAFRVFQFVAACRRAGLGWQPQPDAGKRRAANHGMAGPARIRVGHFTVDRIEPSGTFTAGCHTIHWPEIAALAERLGVADCMAEPETISGELETAA